MVAFLRKVSALVVAAALILCTSIPAFASNFSGHMLYYLSPGWVQLASGSSNTLSYSDSLNAGGFVQYVDVPSGSSSSIFTSSFWFQTTEKINDLSYNVAAIDLVDNSNRFDVSISDVYMPEPLLRNGIYNYTVTLTYSINTLSKNNFRYQVQLFFGKDNSGSNLQMVPVSEVVVGADIYDSSIPSIPLRPTFPSPSGGSSFDGIYSDYEFTIWPDWSSLIYQIELMWFGNLGPFFDGLFDNLAVNFDSSVNSVKNFFGSRLDRQDENYQAVTDPSTSQEIQDTQQMIDDVEDFEASLNQTITTEFNKIDFTTPTNLAAPVAYVGDKVTRSVNSLGNYQPLIFVPLTLGIMLIMLGRGVSALGAFASSSGRKISSIKSKRGDS